MPPPSPSPSPRSGGQEMAEAAVTQRGQVAQSQLQSQQPSAPAENSDDDRVSAQQIISDEVEEISRVIGTTAAEVYRGLNIDNFNPNELPSMVDKFCDKLASASKAQQITAGGVTGWCCARITGFLFSKIGKPFLYLFGGGIIVVLFAEHQGYLQVDWERVRHDYALGRRAVEHRIHTLNQNAQLLSRRNGRPWTEKVKVLAKSSPYLGGGFLGGVLLGLAS